MPVYKESYTVINIWTYSNEKTISNTNGISHISIKTPEAHMNFWPLRPQSPEKGLVADDGKVLSPFMSWLNTYESDYEQDCIIEGASRNARRIEAETELELGEYAYRFDKDTGRFNRVDEVPSVTGGEYYGITPVNANLRVALYSLDTDKVRFEFDRLKKKTHGFRLVGSNALARCVSGETDECCASLVYRCLKAGGMYSKLKTELSWQTSSIVVPEDLLRHVVAAKEKELIDYPQTAAWEIPGMEDTSLDDAFLQARKLLVEACDDYIQHNQLEMDGLKAKHSGKSKTAFFNTVLSKGTPEPGFKDCNPYDYYDSGDYPFAQMQWWSGQGEGVDQTEPAVVLHNLQALSNLLDFHVKRSSSEVYEKLDSTDFSDAPVSIQIYQALKNLRLKAQHAESVMQKNQNVKFLSNIYQSIDKAMPDFEGYLKGVAIQELKDVLEDRDYNDKEAIRLVEAQLKSGITIELLKKNRQSSQERDLKFLSVISICIGIGVFTTLGLMFKRYCDSGGTSINFFKPLSQNLYETIDEVTTNLEQDFVNRGYFSS